MQKRSHDDASGRKGGGEDYILAFTPFSPARSFRTGKERGRGEGGYTRHALRRRTCGRHQGTSFETWSRPNTLNVFYCSSKISRRFQQYFQCVAVSSLNSKRQT